MIKENTTLERKQRFMSPLTVTPSSVRSSIREVFLFYFFILQRVKVRVGCIAAKSTAQGEITAPSLETRNENDPRVCSSFCMLSINSKRKYKVVLYQTTEPTLFPAVFCLLYSFMKL